ncbi:ATP synthase subunit b, mitochondrial [Atheta coriaria]|uniref:ATP synthase subunit b, mitochondrial n=1 Tax=Dalotia coriaria TaxID=877792 RepID=UPI0031F43DF5
MLSRASLLSGQNRALVAFARATGTTPANSAPAADAASGSVSRPVRGEPGKVRMGFLPEEWFTFFYKKTGVTGPYTLGVTVSTYLISKEIYVMEHEYYSGLSLLLMIYLGVTKLGPSIAQYLDKEIDDYERNWNEGRVNEKEVLQTQIKGEEKLQWSAEGQNILSQAKRENVQLQLEAAYRERMMNAYSEVKKRLDFQVEKQDIERRAAHKCMVDYVVKKVKSSITPDQDKANIDKCIADLAGLAKA